MSRYYVLSQLALIVVTLSCAIAAPNGFPSRTAVDSEVHQLASLNPVERGARLSRFLHRLLHPRNHNEEDILGFAAWNITVLYRTTGDDNILVTIRAAGFDTMAADAFLGGVADQLESDPSFLSKHSAATDFVKREHGGYVRPLPRLEIRCKETPASIASTDRWRESRGLPPLEMGFLLVGTDPPAKVIVDGKDSGLMTPVSKWNNMKLALGVHQIDLVLDGKVTRVEVDLKERQNACIYRNLL